MPWRKGSSGNHILLPWPPSLSSPCPASPPRQSSMAAVCRRGLAHLRMHAQQVAVACLALVQPDRHCCFWPLRVQQIGPGEAACAWLLVRHTAACADGRQLQLEFHLEAELLGTICGANDDLHAVVPLQHRRTEEHAMVLQLLNTGAPGSMPWCFSCVQAADSCVQGRHPATTQHPPRPLCGPGPLPPPQTHPQSP